MGVIADRRTAHERVDATYELMLSGWAAPKIVGHLRRSLHLSRRQSYRYIKRARQRMEEEAAKLREESFAEHLAVRRLLRRIAVQKGDMREALAILKDEAQLLGLYQHVASTSQEGELHDIGTYVLTDNPTTAELAHALLDHLANGEVSNGE